MKLITLLVVIAGVIALAQLAKVGQLTSLIRNKKEEDISDADTRLNGGLFIAFMVAFYASFIFLIIRYGDYNPPAASAHGESYDTLMNFNMYIIMAVFFLVNSVLFIFANKYRFDKERKARFFAHDNRLELIWTVIPSIVLAVIIIYGLRTWNEIEGYTDIPQNLETIPLEKVQELRHGYYACISYIDTLVGRLLDRLDQLALTNNTIICFWSDHGFHLGEQGLWTKANNYELSARVPLILSVPGQTHSGSVSQALVELVDLYPTLSEICGLPLSPNLEGLSLVPLLQDPNQPWKTAVFNQWPRDFTEIKHKRHGDVMGYSIRTERFRYVQWREWVSGKIHVHELYDHQSDPNEMNNLAGHPEYASTLVEHQRRLDAGWESALPTSR